MSQVPSNPAGIAFTVNAGGNLAQSLQELQTLIAGVRSQLTGMASDLNAVKAKSSAANSQLSASLQGLSDSLDSISKASKTEVSDAAQTTRAIQAKTSALKSLADAEEARLAAWRKIRASDLSLKAQSQIPTLITSQSVPTTAQQRVGLGVGSTADKGAVALTKEIEKQAVAEQKASQILQKNLDISLATTQAKTADVAATKKVVDVLDNQLRKVEAIADAVSRAGRDLNSLSVPEKIGLGLASASGINTGTSQQIDKAILQSKYNAALKDGNAAQQQAARADLVRAQGEAALERQLLKTIAAEQRLGNTQLQDQLVREKVATFNFQKTISDRVKAVVQPATGQGVSAVDFLKRMLGLDPDAARSQLDRLAASMRRLVATVLVLKAIRIAITGFETAVGDAVKFNAEMETARLGIAAVIAGTGQVRDQMGSLVSGAQEFAIAQKAAAEQLKLLRVDALNTVAPLARIVETFQTAVGPGLAAGLNLDQVRQFSVSISKAASAIGLEQNQLAEEIRSILTGTISKRQTRIATVLGITNDDIKRAKEAGTLVDLLNEKFASFELAGQKVGDTFEGALNRAKSAVQAALGEASLGFFGVIKSLLQDVSNLLITVDRQTNTLTINPQFSTAVSALFDQLSQMAQSVRGLIAGMDFTDLAKSAEFLGTTLKLAFATILGAAQGVIASFQFIEQALEGVANAIKAISGNRIDLFDADQLRKFVAGLTEVVVGYQLVVRTGAAIAGVMKAWAASTAAVRNAHLVLNTTVAATTAAVEGVGIAAAGVDLVLKRSIIGLVAAVVAIGALFLLEKTGVLGSITDKLIGKTSDLDKKKAQLQDLRAIVVKMFDNIPTSIAGSTQSLKDQTNAIEDLRKEYEKLALQRDLSFRSQSGQQQPRNIPISSLSGFASDAAKIALDAALEAQTKARALQKDQANLQSTIEGLTQQRIRSEADLLTLEQQHRLEAGKLFEAKKLISDNEQKMLQLQARQTAKTLPEVVAPQQQVVQKTLTEMQPLLQDFSAKPGAGGEVSARQQILDSLKEESRVRLQLFALRKDEARLDSEKTALSKDIEATQVSILRSQQFYGKNNDLAVADQKTLVGLQSSYADAAARLADTRGKITAFVAEQKTIEADIADQVSLNVKDENKRKTFLGEALAIMGKMATAQQILDRIDVTQNGEKQIVTEETRRDLVARTNAEMQRLITSQVAYLSQLGLAPEQQQRIVDALRKSLEIDVQRQGAEAQLKSLREAELKVQEEINHQANARLEIAARQFSFEAQTQAETLRSERLAQSLDWASRLGTQEEKNLASVRGQIATLQIQISQRRQILELQQKEKADAVARLQSQNASLNFQIRGNPLANFGPTTPSFKDLSQSEQAALIEKSVQAQRTLVVAVQAERDGRAAVNEELGKANDKLINLRTLEQEAAIRAGGEGVSLAQQIRLAAKDLVSDLPSRFQVVLDTLRTGISGFSSFISDSIIDAFDPTKKVDIRQRFGQFLLDFSRQVINTLVTIATTKAVLGLTSILGFSEGGAVPSAFHAGGRVRRQHRPFAGGGQVGGTPVPELRPRNFHPNDNVPVPIRGGGVGWLDPREFVHPVATVATYGLDAMEALRRRIIDPIALRSLLPSSRGNPAIRHTSGSIHSFASGGSVPSARASTTVGSAAATSGPVPAIVVAGDASVDRLLRGGRTALTRLLDEEGFVRR